jgi:hypothetical protein
MVVGRPALARCRLAGKQLILLDETRAGAVTQPMARPAQVPEGQLAYGALRRLHDEHDMLANGSTHNPTHRPADMAQDRRACP